MDNSHEPSAVRILPDSRGEPPRSPTRQSRRLIPAAVLATIGGFLLLTGGRDTTNTEVTITPAPPIASVNAENLDFRTPSDVVTTNEWTAFEIAEAAEIHDLTRGRSTYVAVGATAAGAQVWTSGTGTRWSTISNVERPGARSSIDRVVLGTNRLVGLGRVDGNIGVWTSAVANSWVYAGPLDDAVGGSIVGLAAGDEVLAMVATDTGYRAWVSEIGLEWTPLEPLQGLDKANLNDLTAGLGAYFTFGTESGCAMIYRSTDGVSWQPTLEPVDGCGAVIDLVAEEERMLALGWTTDSFDRTRVAIWESTDGIEWKQIAVDEPLLAADGLNLELVETQPEAGPVAVVRVNGELTTATNGTVLQTDNGSFTVAAITGDGLELTQNGDSVRVTNGHTAEFWRVLHPMRIAAEGDRIAIVGSMTAEGYRASVPVVWSSADRGETWTMAILPGSSAQAYEVGTRATGVVAVATYADGISGWRTTWDTTTAAEEAVTLAQTYLNAIAAYDPNGVLTTVPATIGTAEQTDYQVPSLGHQIPGWWDDTGAINRSRVADTMQYLEALNTSLTVGDCTVGVNLGPTDRASVACSIVVDSDLLALYGIEHGEGTFAGVVRGGRLVTAQLDPDPAAALWALLATRLESSPAQVMFDQASAAIHLQTARAHIARLLQPGQTKTVTTTLGTMEWTWVDESELAPTFLDSVVWTPIGFAAVGYENHAPASLLVSPDGFDWSPVALPVGIESVWGLEAFGDGFLGSTWDGDGSSLVYYDGLEWTEIALPIDRRRVDYWSIAAGSESALVGSWQLEGDGESVTFEMYRVAADLTARAVAVPPQLATGGPWLGYTTLDATSSGFLASFFDYETRATAVWTTRDGEAWSLLTERLTLDGSPAIWNLQVHRDRYFVVGDGAELVCYETDYGEDCSTISQMWMSADGTQWQELLTTTGSAVAATDIGSGPLGLLAFGGEIGGEQQSRSLYVSGDGALWEEVPGLALLNPGKPMWWWTSRPAVGTDTVVLVGSSYREAESGFNGEESPILIVGRLLDR